MADKLIVTVSSEKSSDDSYSVSYNGEALTLAVAGAREEVPTFGIWTIRIPVGQPTSLSI